MNARAGDRPSIPTAEKLLSVALVIVAAIAILAFVRAAVLVDRDLLHRLRRDGIRGSDPFIHSLLVLCPGRNPPWT